MFGSAAGERPALPALFWILALFSAATRFLAMSRSIWEWDETLFCLGMRDYDVASHHPHPPGFPVYIAAAKLLRTFIPSDFRALQTLNLVAGVLLFPAMFLLARELRLRFSTSIIAALLLSFFPNVWFFGGTAFSDVVSLTLVVFAVAMFIRGFRDANAYLIGTFALALSLGIRPQNLLIGLVPGAIATWHRARESVRDVVFAALIGIVTVVVAYGSAIYATGSYEQYMNAVRAHSIYITNVDSFHAAARPPLWRLFDRFFMKQYESPPLSVIISIFVVVSIVGAIRQRDRRIGLIAAAFVPFAIAAWLMLDRFSITRFSIGYAPLFAVLAADGITRAVRGRDDLTLIAGGALAAAFFAWTLPALTPVRNDVAPSVAAVQAIGTHLDPARDHLFVAFSMVPFVQYFTPYFPYQRVLDERALPLSIGKRRAWLLAEIDHTKPHGLVFQRDREKLWNIARRHYFEVALEPVDETADFASGWYGAERAEFDEWRWMGPRSLTVLPPATGETELRIHGNVRPEIVGAHITVVLNGKTIEQFATTGTEVAKDYWLQPAAEGRKNVLELSIDRTIPPQPGGDPRSLGFQLVFLSWGPG